MIRFWIPFDPDAWPGGKGPSLNERDEREKRQECIVGEPTIGRPSPAARAQLAALAVTGGGGVRSSSIVGRRYGRMRTKRAVLCHASATAM